MTPDERQAFIRADLGIIETPDPACVGDGACPQCGDVDPGPYDLSDPCRACGYGPTPDPRQDERAELERALRNLVAAYRDPFADFDAHLLNAQDVLRGMDGP